MIKFLNLEIINICNLKCKICDIWKNKSLSSLETQDIKNILSSKKISKDIDITITGGELLLHKNIIKVFDIIYKLGYKVSTISTNGTIYGKLNNILQFCDENGYIKPNIHISIDGNEEIHDRQRGIRGSFKKSIETIIKLKQQYKNINIKLKYTITKDNIKYIKFAYTLSRKIGVDISYKLVENDVNYTNRLSYPCLLDDKEKRIVIQNLFELYGNSDKYINNLIYYIKNKNLNFECKTPKVSLFIMANGDVYSCIKYNSIGNIKSGNLDSIINSEASKAIIKEVKDTKCNNCYSLHGSYKSII